MNLSAVFSPRSIAVIGASSEPGTVGNELVKNLVAGYQGRIYPINLKGEELYGLRVLRSIKEVSTPVDLAVIAVPAPIVPTVLAETGRKKVKAAVIISSGFREAGNAELEKEVTTVAKKYKITLVGPNCLGVMNPQQQMNASFAPTMPPSGSISFLSQSGALGSAILDYACANSMGFAKFLSLGNKALVDEQRVLEYLAHDPQTKVILMYIEQLSEFEPILRTALKIRKSRHPKPIIVLKSGSTEQGMVAAKSHTGALAGKDAFYDGLFRQAGIIRAQSIEELFLFAQCFTSNPLLKKDRVAVITNAGGLGVLVTDALVREKLKLSPLSPSIIRTLRTFLPQSASVSNPVDILGDATAETYKKTIATVAADDRVDAIAVLLTPQSMTKVEQTAQAIAQAKISSTKPVLVSFLGGDRVKEGLGMLREHGKIGVPFPEWTAKGLGALHRFSQWRDDGARPVGFRDIDHAKIRWLLESRRSKEGWLEEEVTLNILAACKIPVLPWKVVRTATETKQAVRSVGGRAAMKILSHDIVHKSDVGGIELDVTQTNAETTFSKMMEKVRARAPHAVLRGVMVMKQSTAPSEEMLVGAVRDPNLGELVACGMGGIHAETLADTAFELLPVSSRDIDDMVDRLRVAKILAGSRGQRAYDRHALAKIVARISVLTAHHHEIAELDVNPLFVYQAGKGVAVADARLRCL